MAGDLRRALCVFDAAMAYSTASGLDGELVWQRSVSLPTFTESDLLREGAWVILCSGFREAVVRKVFDHVSLCFCDWESAELIVQESWCCQRAAMASFRNERKLNAICQMAGLICKAGFATFKTGVLTEPIAALSALPYIGPITAMHLAKNLGFDVAKPDRHLVRLTEWLGYRYAFDLCNEIADQTGEPVRVVDLLLWRFMANVQPSCQGDLPV